MKNLLFDIQDPFDQEAKTLAVSDPTECYKKLRLSGQQIGLSLWFVIRMNLRGYDNELTHDFFEENGFFSLCDIKVCGKRFRVTDDDCNLKLNRKLIWEQPQQLPKDVMKTVKEKLKNYIIKNQYQFGLK